VENIMSEAAKAARKAMHAKIARITRTDPNQKVDASGYVTPDPLDADKATGMRPISRRQFKRGGKVMDKVDGCAPSPNAGRMARKSGGSTYAIDLMNRNQKEANEKRDGVKHVGGFKRGGAPKKSEGGLAGPSDKSFVPTSRMAFNGATSMAAKAAGLPSGSSSGGGGGGEPTGNGRQAYKAGGRQKRADGGELNAARLRSMNNEGRDFGRTAAQLDKAVPPKVPVKTVASGPSPEEIRMAKAAAAQNAAATAAAGRAGAAASRPVPYKKGGEASFEGSKEDMRQDKKLAAKYKMSHADWEKSEMDEKHDRQKSMKGLKHGGSCSCAKCSGGYTARKDGGRAHKADGGILQMLSPAAALAANPKAAKYLSPAAMLLGAKKDGGSVSDGVFQGTRPTGGRMARKHGGRTGKGKTNINIIIGGHPGGQQAQPGAGAPPMPPRGVPVPVAPAGPPPGMPMGGPPPGGPPPGMMPPMGPPPGGPPMGPPPGMPMPRKSGGRVAHAMAKGTTGAGGGLGRLKKIDLYGEQ